MTSLCPGYWTIAADDSVVDETASQSLVSDRIASGPESALITGRQSEIVARRAANLDIEHVYQGRNDKLDALNELLTATGLEESQVCFAGDDWIDIPVLDRVGLAVTVPDADAVVKSHAHWITPHAGGHGAVRDICDLILAARGLDRVVLEGILGP